MKKKKSIIILLVVLAILLIIIVCLYQKVSSNRSINDLKAITYKEMMQEMVMPNGIFQLRKNYTGNNDLQDFYRSIYDFSREIINLSKKKEKNIDNYYEKNKVEIKNKSGIKTLEEYKKLWEYLQKFEKLNSLKSATIDTETFSNTYKCLEFYMNLTFDQEKEIKFYVKLNNKISSNVAKYELIDE